MDLKKETYVYVYLDPRKIGKYMYENINMSFLYEPFYVGKGKDNRYLHHIRDAKITKISNYRLNKIRKIKSELNTAPFVIKIKENLSDVDAIKLEIGLITSIGRIDKKQGTLTNLTDGGDGVSGRIVTKEERLRISIANSGKNNPNYGNGDKIRGDKNPMFGRDRSGKLAPNYGKKFSDETKKKISQSRIKSGVALGSNNPNWKGGISSIAHICPKCNCIMNSDSNVCQMCYVSNIGGKNNPNYGNTWNASTKILASLNRAEYMHTFIDTISGIKYRNIISFNRFRKKFNIGCVDFSNKNSNIFKWKHWRISRYPKNFLKMSKFDVFFIDVNFKIINNKIKVNTK
jgi:hypothetical protein